MDIDLIKMELKIRITSIHIGYHMINFKEIKTIKDYKMVQPLLLVIHTVVLPRVLPTRLEG